jgi:hypothetical protein
LRIERILAMNHFMSKPNKNMAKVGGSGGENNSDIFDEILLQL